MSAHILLPRAVDSESERKGDLLPPLGFEPATVRMLAYLSTCSTKSHWAFLFSWFQVIPMFLPGLGTKDPNLFHTVQSVK
jgi:hypothetical protein